MERSFCFSSQQACFHSPIPLLTSATFTPSFMKPKFFYFLLLLSLKLPAVALNIVTNVEWQPVQAQVQRIAEAMDYLGQPMQQEDLGKIASLRDHPQAVTKVQQILDRYSLFGVHINPEMRVKVAQGPASAELDEQGWKIFLVKVENESGTTAPLRVKSPNAGRMAGADSKEIPNRWLDVAMYDAQPLKPALSGLPLEYRIIQLYSRDRGSREARFSFDVGQGTQDLGFRNETDVLFRARAAAEIVLKVKDENEKPTTASFLIKDKSGRVYPAQSKRLAPDFSFHPQIYRQDGESIRLPSGQYAIEVSRGPESITQRKTVVIDENIRELSFKMERWIDPSLEGWWSGDHHIHAAGCAHYVKPTEGVHAADMIRHIIGEDLKVGANLTWGPSFDYQKQFFCGEVDKVSKYPYLLRYDIEVSGFGSHQSGHLCLLRLREQMYPGGDSKHHWPTLGLNTLKWAKAQGAVTGPAHSGWGLEVQTAELPNHIIPPYSGIGANEYIMNVTHKVPDQNGVMVPAVDFLSMVDTPYVWELNMWYHTLNAGFRTRISGETDFPCIYGEKVGLGRSYVKLDGKLDYDAWCEGIRKGRNYVGDGRSHLIDFRVNDVVMGENGSELRMARPGKVTVQVRVAAMLPETPDASFKNKDYTQKPYWDLERSRLGDGREVPVELVINGEVKGLRKIQADGKWNKLEFELELDRSAWVALRILPSSHTNPIFVLVGDRPILEKKSVEWCLKGVEKCWSEKEQFYAQSELEAARQAYDHARKTYRAMLD